MTRRQGLAALGVLVACGAARIAHAATYPSGPLKLLVGSPPGGPADFLARIYAQTLAPALGQAIAVENRPGASGTLAADAVAQMPADGHTLLVSGPSAISAAPHLVRLGYDPATDLVPVSMLGVGGLVLAVPAGVPAASVRELVALARRQPGSLSYGSAGNGSSAHLCAELFCRAAGAKMLHVPYKGDAQAVNDLLAGRVHALFTSQNVALPFVDSGRLRLLAVTTRQRLPGLPQVPTVSESVARDFEYLAWIGSFAPAGTPAAVVEALAAAWNRLRSTPPVRGRLDELSMQAPDRIASGAPLALFLREESTRLGKLIREASIKAE